MMLAPSLTQVPTTEATLSLARKISFCWARDFMYQTMGTHWNFLSQGLCPNQEQSGEVDRWLLKNEKIQGTRWERVNRVGRKREWANRLVGDIGIDWWKQRLKEIDQRQKGEQVVKYFNSRNWRGDLEYRGQGPSQTEQRWWEYRIIKIRVGCTHKDGEEIGHNIGL